jgi:hypothetical protein
MERRKAKNMLHLLGRGVRAPPLYRTVGQRVEARFDLGDGKLMKDATKKRVYCGLATFRDELEPRPIQGVHLIHEFGRILHGGAIEASSYHVVVLARDQERLSTDGENTRVNVESGQIAAKAAGT